MKLNKAKICPECDEVFDEKMCPACGNEQGIFIGNTIMPLADGRIRRVETPHSEKLRVVSMGHGA